MGNRGKRGNRLREVCARPTHGLSLGNRLAGAEAPALVLGAEDLKPVRGPERT